MKIHPVFHIPVLQPTKNSESSEDVEAQDMRRDFRAGKNNSKVLIPLLFTE
jgi:hypothetical protein